MDTHHPAFEDMDEMDAAMLAFHCRQLVDDLAKRYGETALTLIAEACADRFGFVRARNGFAYALGDRAGNRPVVIDHIQEPN